LVEGENPIGGKWSFDAENRKKMPRSIQVPQIFTSAENKYVAEAKKYVASTLQKTPAMRMRLFIPSRLRMQKNHWRIFLKTECTCSELMKMRLLVKKLFSFTPYSRLR